MTQRQRQIALTVATVCVLAAGLVFAQGQQPLPRYPQAPPVGDTISSGMFYWLVGLGSAIVGTLTGVVATLWRKLTNRENKQATGRWDAERAELRAEIGRWQTRYFRQQTKMEKLAVRTQRAVEAVAGMTVAPEVESDLDDVEANGNGDQG